MAYIPHFHPISPPHSLVISSLAGDSELPRWLISYRGIAVTDAGICRHTTLLGRGGRTILRAQPKPLDML